MVSCNGLILAVHLIISWMDMVIRELYFTIMLTALVVYNPMVTRTAIICSICVRKRWWHCIVQWNSLYYVWIWIDWNNNEYMEVLIEWIRSLIICVWIWIDFLNHTAYPTHLVQSSLFQFISPSHVHSLFHLFYFINIVQKISAEETGVEWKQRWDILQNRRTAVRPGTALFLVTV